MVVILLEGVLFVALLATLGALFVLAARRTPAGLRLRQTANRRRIERQAAVDSATRCAVHGPCAEHDLVRLPGGGQLCPACYREMFDDPQ
jgi:hypothetical protein